MNMEEFCVALSQLNLNQPRQALALLWFVDRDQPGAGRTPGELARALRNAGLGYPHSTKLGEAIMRTGHVLRAGDRLRIKPTSRAVISKSVSTILAPRPPEVDQDTGFLPEAIWKGTRTYIEKIARQVNGCYQFGFYDGASVLIRRIIETLLIECYEHLKIEGKIKKGQDYPMLSEIIVGAVDQGHLSLARESKKVLREIKMVGDRSAHNRRYTAVKADLEKLQSGVRLVVDELLHLASLK